VIIEQGHVADQLYVVCHGELVTFHLWPVFLLQLQFQSITSVAYVSVCIKLLLCFDMNHLPGFVWDWSLSSYIQMEQNKLYRLLWLSIIPLTVNLIAPTWSTKLNLKFGWGNLSNVHVHSHTHSITERSMLICVYRINTPTLFLFWMMAHVMHTIKSILTDTRLWKSTIFS
jgi:hypothetical protein